MGRNKLRKDERKRAKETKQLNRIYKRDRAVCWICLFLGRSVAESFVAREDASRDHLTPLSKGRDDRDENMRLAHRSCNSKRGDLTIEQMYELIKEDV